MALRFTQATPHSVTLAVPASAVRDAVAVASMAAGAIHLAVAPSHASEPAHGVFFLVVGALQILWGFLALAMPSSAVYGASVANAGVIAIWVASRTVGLSLGGGHPHVEAIGAVDLAATILEIAVLAGALKLLVVGFRTPIARADVTNGAPVLAGALTVALLFGYAFAPQLPVEDRQHEDAVAHASGAHAPVAAADDAGTAEADKPNTHVVKALDNVFRPQRLRIEPGDTVKWINEGAAPHTASSDTGVFESGDLAAGESFSFTFEEEGAYFYYCKYHGSPGKNGMWGVVIVAEKDSKAVPVHAAAAPTPTSSGSDQAATRSVSITDNAFSPRELHVQVGDTVAWTNNGASIHDVVADEGAFGSPDLSPGSRFSYTFDNSGVFYYHCSFHGAPRSGMWGVIVVSEPGEHVAALPPPPTKQPRLAPLRRAPDTKEVRMSADSFSPQRVKIRKGDTVVWSNASAVSHTVTSESSSFDSGIVEPGRRFRKTFARAGRYYYFCELHGSPRRGMWGVVIVTRSDGDAPRGGRPRPPRDDPDPPPPPDDGTGVTIVDDAFRPKELEVDVGDEVVWSNSGARAHTVTAEDGSFDSGFLPSGAKFRHRFDEEGRFYYFCEYHGGPREGMWGVVTVSSPDPEPSPSPSPSPSATAAGLALPGWTVLGLAMPFSIAARRRAATRKQERKGMTGTREENQRGS